MTKAQHSEVTQWDRDRAQVRKDFISGLMLYLEFCAKMDAIDIAERDANRAALVR